MYRPKDTKERIIHRLKISRGQLDKVMAMMEADEYCIDVLHQSQAVQKALQNTDYIILEHHLQHCTKEAFAQGNHQKAIDEILAVVKKGSH